MEECDSYRRGHCKWESYGYINDNSFQQKSITIAYSSLISITASGELVFEELRKLSTMPTKIFIVHVSPSLASHLFLNAKYLGMTDAGCKWIVTSKTMNFLSFIDDEVIESMQGVVGYKSYISQSMDLHKFTLKWRKEYHVKEINAYAIWAYDAVSALAMAVERTHKLNKGSRNNWIDSMRYNTSESDVKNLI